MTKGTWGILMGLILGASAAVAQSPTSITVNCNSGQSLNVALTKLNKQGPNTVSVNGTCTEYVQVFGFENLTLKGLAGATLGLIAAKLLSLLLVVLLPPPGLPPLAYTPGIVGTGLVLAGLIALFSTVIPAVANARTISRCPGVGLSGSLRGRADPGDSA